MGIFAVRTDQSEKQAPLSNGNRRLIRSIDQADFIRADHPVRGGEICVCSNRKVVPVSVQSKVKPLAAG